MPNLHFFTWPGNAINVGTASSQKNETGCFERFNEERGEITNLLGLFGTHGDKLRLWRWSAVLLLGSKLLSWCAVWKSSPTLADALLKWIEVEKGVEAPELSRWNDFLRPYKWNWTRGTRSSHRAGRLQVVSRWHREEKARLVSRWKRVERLCERSVSFSIFKVPSLLLRDATGGVGGGGQ